MAPAGGQKSCKKAAAPIMVSDTDVAMEESQPEMAKRKHLLTSDAC